LTKAASKVTEEISKQCRQSIVDHVAWCRETLSEDYEQPCVFGDIRDAIYPGTFDQKFSFEKKFRAVNRARVVPKQHCFTHNCMCPIFGPESRADADFSGLPCPDFSSAGKKRREEGPSNDVSFGSK